MEPSISLIIPVYNVEKYLTPCLDSVVNQIIPFDEVLIVNDGSTDHSLEICEKYVSAYKYFTLISQENKGLSSARNRGINAIAGDYVMFLDSDDYLRMDAVKILKKKLQDELYDTIFFDAKIFFDEELIENKKNLYDRSLAGLDETVMSGEEYFSKCYPEKYIVSVCMAIYKTQLVKDKYILFPEGLNYEDNYFSFVFLGHAKKVIHVSRKLYNRRFRMGSIIQSSYSEKKLSDHIQIGLLIWEEMGKRRNELSLEIKKLFLRYASDYYRMVLERFCYCKTSNIFLGDKTKADLQTMAERYGLLLKILQLEKIEMDLLLLNQILWVLQCTSLYIGKNWDEDKLLIQDLVSKQKDIYCGLLNQVPLNKSEFKVGIYGIGKHTKGLLTIYEKLYGKINCNLFFLDSYKDNGCFWGRKVKNYKELDLSTDMIILSSFLYEKEMLENIKNVKDNIQVYRFYQDIKNDIFSEYEKFLPYW